MPPSAAALRSIRIERSGGIAGLAPSVERDAAALTASERQALDAIRQAPPAAPASASAGAAPTRGVSIPADRFRYRVVLTDIAGGVVTRVLDEAQMPDALQQLCRPGG